MKRLKKRIKSMWKKKAGNKKQAVAPRKAMIEALEPRLLLSVDLAPGAEEVILGGLEELTDWSDGLDGINDLTQPLPGIFDKTDDGAQPVTLEGELSKILKEGLLDPVSEYFKSFDSPSGYDEFPAVPSSAGLATFLDNAFGDAVDVTDLSVDGQVLFQVQMNTENTTSFTFDLGRNSDLYGLSLDSKLNLDTTLDFDLTFGIDPETNEFFIRSDGLNLSADIHETGFSIDGQVGVLGVKIGDSTENTFVNLDTELNVNFNNPDGGDITLSELNEITIEASGSLEANLPVSGQLGDFTFPGSPVIELSAEDVFSETFRPFEGSDDQRAAPEITLTDFESLLDFTHITPESLVGMFEQLGSWFGQFDGISSEDIGAFFDASIPFAENMSLGDILDLSDAFKGGFLSDLIGENGFDETQEQTDENDDGKIEPFINFGTIQEMLEERLQSSVDGEDAIHYDPGTKELTFDLNIAHTFKEDVANIDFDLDLDPLGDISSSTQVTLGGDVAFDFTLGVGLDGIIGDVPISLVAGLRQPDSKLTGDAHFTLTIGDNEPVEVTVLQSDTAENQNFDDLADDIQKAVTLALGEAGLNANVQVENANGSIRVFTEDANALKIEADENDPAITELGFADGQVFENTHAELLSSPGTPLKAVLSEDAHFFLTIGKNDPVEVTVLQSNTAENEDVDNLVRDIRAAIDLSIGEAGLDAVVIVDIVTTEDGDDAIRLITADANILKIEADGNDPILTELGFNDGQTSLSLAELFSSNERNPFTPSDGVLSGDAHFFLTIGENDPMEITVLQTETAANATTSDLVADIAAAIDTAIKDAGLEDQFVVKAATEETPQDADPEDRKVIAVHDANGRIALSSDDVNLLRINVAASDPAATELGFQDGQMAKSQSRFLFIEDPSLKGTIELKADNIEADAKFGFLEIGTSGGTASLTGGIDLVLKDPGTVENDGRIEMKELFGVISNPSTIGDIVESSDIYGSAKVELKNIYSDPDIFGLNETLTEKSLISISLDDLDDLSTLKISPIDASGLLDFENLSFDSIADALGNISTFLENLDVPFINDPLPLINISLGSVVDYVGTFTDVLEDFKENPGSAIQELEQQIEEALGLPTGSDVVNLELIPGDALKIDLELSTGFNESLPINIDLGDDFANLTGNAGLSAEGDATLHLDFGIDLDDPTQIYLYDSTALTFDARAAGENLNFTAAMGPLGLHIAGGAAVLDRDGDPNTTEPISLTVDIPDDPSDHRYALDELGNISLDTSLEGQVAATLPVYFPTTSNFIGNVEFEITDLNDITGTTSFGELPDFNAIIGDLDILDTLSLVSEGLDQLLGGLQDILDGEVFGMELPLIGDSLADGAQFIEDFREEVVSKVRDALENAPEKAAEVIQEALFDVFGPDRLNVLADNNGDGEITKEDVGMEVLPESIEWDMALHQDLIASSVPLDFDLGIPGLGLDVDGDVDLKLAWDLDFGFGVSMDEGFYFDTSGDDELEVDLKVAIPDLKAEGSLAFLQLDVTDKGSSFIGDFTVDIIDPGKDGKLVLAEIPGIDVDATLNAVADVDLDIVASFGGNTAFPSVSAGFALDWSFKDADTKSSLEGGSDLQVSFNDVSMNFGSFISDFISPILNKVQDVVAPFNEPLFGDQSIIDIITTPIPVISDLAGPTTLLDLAEQMGYMTEGTRDFIEAACDILELVDLLGKLPSDAGDISINFGSFSIVGDQLLTSSSASELELENQTTDDNWKKQILDESGENNDFINAFLDFVDSDSSKKRDDKPDYGFKLPFLEDPTQVFGLLLGKPVTLVTYDLPPLGFNFMYSQFFPVWGPLGARITGEVGMSADFAFGFDTFGLQKFSENDFKTPIDIFLGFYVSDTLKADGTGPDVPEIEFEAGISAAAELNAWLIRGGVGGGLYAGIDLNLDDPIADGKVRINELIGNFELGMDYFGNPFLAPIALFDVECSLTAKLFAYVKAEFFGKTKTLWEHTFVDKEIFSFDWSIPKPPVLATDAGDGVLRLSMGPYAEDRLHENTEDGDEDLTVTQNGGTVTVSGYGTSMSYEDITHIVVDSGAGNDTITFDGVTATMDIVGGFGDDTIILTERTTGSATIRGGSGNDTIIGGSGNDEIYGEKGQDSINGGAGNDILDGGTESDIINGGMGLDTIRGGDDDDILSGGDDADEIYGDAGHDDIKGDAGKDTLFGGIGKDTISGGTEADELYGEEGQDELYGDAGDDILIGGTENDRLFGGSENDILLGDNGRIEADGVVLLGGSGNDEIHGGTGDDTAYGGVGADSIYGDEDHDSLFGNSGDDDIYGGEGQDHIEGFTGNDVLFGDNGEVRLMQDQMTRSYDVIRTTDETVTGDDTIQAGAGEDMVFGGSGADELIGNVGDDILFGDNGQIDFEFDSAIGASFVSDMITTGTTGENDRIIGEEGDDTVMGGAGGDVIFGDASPDMGGADVIIGDGGHVTLVSGEIDVIETIGTVIDAAGNADEIHGGLRADIILGGMGADILNGNEGRDRIIGDNGRLDYGLDEDRSGLDRIRSTDPESGDNDEITGGTENDIVLGGFGEDTLQGGQGDDILSGDNSTIHYDPDGEMQRFATTFSDIGGDDIIHGDDGSDILFGGYANDRIDGGSDDGNDILFGDNGVIGASEDTGHESRKKDTAPDASANDDASDASDSMAPAEPDYTTKDTIPEDSGNDDAFETDTAPSDGAADNGDASSDASSDDASGGDTGEGDSPASGSVAAGNDLYSTAPDHGGEDTITGGAGNDIIVGGSGGDDTTGLGGDDLSGNEGDDLIVGDNAYITRDASDAVLKIDTGDADVEKMSYPDKGGDEIIRGGQGDDTLIGGFGADTIDGNEDMDTILGDNAEFTMGELLTTVNPLMGHSDTITGGTGNDLILGGTAGDHLSGNEGADRVFGDHGKIDLQQPANENFTAIDTGASDGGGVEIIHGDAGNDTLLGQQGADILFGDAGQDDLIGGHNVPGGSDGADIMDGGTDADVLAGDNAEIIRQEGSDDPRYQKLTEKTLYNEDGSAAVTGEAQADPDGAEAREITLFDHSEDAVPGTYGDDLMAGGADNDALFGQMGDDVMRGDGAVAFEDPEELTGASVVASEEVETDGDDYMEGNSGNELMFGDYGQDDIIGGSSALFGLNTAFMRPDGEDTIYGGAGDDTLRNTDGDGLHTADADMILGDNANIYRIVRNGAFETFNYDNYGEDRRIIPRAVDLLDYTADGEANDNGTADLIHGEAGDDTLHGMTGNDVLYGEGQDDDIYGESGDDWLFGGTGDDGILGDDGKILTSRNGMPEPLYDIKAAREGNISTPGNHHTATVNPEGQLKKSVDLEPFEIGDNDVMYGGLGDDSLHGGAGDDMISGAEALDSFYGKPEPGEPEIMLFDDATGDFHNFDDDNPLEGAKKNGDADPAFIGDEFVLDFETYENGGDLDDGKDVLFGDIGNDWLIGGTNNDHVYGGVGNDMMDADDDPNTTTTDRRNDEFYGDTVYGGGGRDTLVANSGDDRLIDWVGEFNAYAVPFANFGMPSVSRQVSPHYPRFLYALSESDGADMTRGNDQRNGEPDGELGLFIQQDRPGWQDQTGGPADPQAGNTPGGGNSRD